MHAEPQNEHRWLQKMVGKWTAEYECSMGPDQPPVKNKGFEVVRSLGGLWVLAEGEGESPDGQPHRSLMSIGFDPQKNKFVGTFVSSMMTFLWVYEGSLDASAGKLTLDTQGPDFSGGGKLVPYQDIIEFKSDDHRTLTSFVLTKEGTWQHIVTAHYHRES